MDEGLPIGHESGEHESGSGSDIGRFHRRPAQRLASAHQRMVAFRLHVGAEADELMDESEPRLKEVFGHQCGSVSNRVECDELGLQVRGEARIRQGDDVDCPRALLHLHPESVVQGRDGRSRGGQLVQGDLQMLRVGPTNGDVAARHRGCHRPGARHDAIGHRRVLDGHESRDPFDLQRRRANAPDRCAHLHEHRADVDYLGFPRSIVDDGAPARSHRGHEESLRRSDTGEVQPDGRTVQSVVGTCNEVAVLARDVRTHALETADVHVEAA